MSELISILMPVKNADNYLEDCLRSIIDQHYQNWELIAVNDHSTDSSADLLKHFARLDERINFAENEANGIIPALRTAFKKAKGELIHRMDADDLMPPNKLATLYEMYAAKGKGKVYTGKVKYFAARGVSNGYKKYENWLNRMAEHQNHWEQLYQECVIASPAWLIHREDLLQCGAFESDRYPEDYDLVFRFYRQGLDVISSKEVVHCWRDHSERTSRNHEHYQANSFFALKLHYFFELDRDFDRPLLIWGAGPKGKRLAKMLKVRGENFKWISNNPNKHGKEIYGKLMRSFKEIIQLDHPQIIITVAQKGAKKEILKFLNENELKEKKDFWFFR